MIKFDDIKKHIFESLHYVLPDVLLNLLLEYSVKHNYNELYKSRINKFIKNGIIINIFASQYISYDGNMIYIDNNNNNNNNNNKNYEYKIKTSVVAVDKNVVYCFEHKEQQFYLHIIDNPNHKIINLITLSQRPKKINFYYVNKIFIRENYLIFYSRYSEKKYEVINNVAILDISSYKYIHNITFVFPKSLDLIRTFFLKDDGLYFLTKYGNIYHNMLNELPKYEFGLSSSFIHCSYINNEYHEIYTLEESVEHNFINVYAIDTFEKLRSLINKDRRFDIGSISHETNMFHYKNNFYLYNNNYGKPYMDVWERQKNDNIKL
jgi:hypothetical protein